MYTKRNIDVQTLNINDEMDFYNGEKEYSGNYHLKKKIHTQTTQLWSLNRDTYYNHIQIFLSYTQTLPFPSLSKAPCWPQQPPASPPRLREAGRFL